MNLPTPVRRRLILTQAARSKPIPTGLAPVRGTKARGLEAFSQYPGFHLCFVHLEARMPNLARLSKRFRAAATIPGVWILVSLGEYLSTHLKDHTRYNRQSSAGWMPESIDRWSVGMERRHQVTMRKASFKTLSIRRV